MEKLLGFGVFIAVAVVITLLLEALLPGTATNPFAGAGIGIVAGWLVTRALGDD